MPCKGIQALHILINFALLIKNANVLGCIKLLQELSLTRTEFLRALYENSIIRDVHSLLLVVSSVLQEMHCKSNKKVI